MLPSRWETWTKYTLHPETMAFKTLGMGHWRIVTSERQEAMEVSLQLSQRTAWTQFPGCGAAMGHPGWAQQSPKLSGHKQKSRKSKWLEFAGQVTEREELPSERTRAEDPPWGFSWGFWMHMWDVHGKKPPEAWERTTERMGAMPSASSGHSGKPQIQRISL